MTTCCDQFGLWLGNNGKLNTLNDAHLLCHQNQIFEIFGGIKAVLTICLSHSDNINLFQHQQLFHLLSDINTNKSELDTNKSPHQSLSINDISISNIFTFLPAIDHQHLQQTCRQLAVIGRYRESYIIHPDTKQYIHFGQHLQFIHKLKHFMHQICSNEPDKINHALNAMLDYIDDEQINKDEMIIVKTGLIPQLLQTLTTSTTNIDIFISVLNFLFSLNYQWNVNKYCNSIATTIINHISNNSTNAKFIESCMNIVYILIYQDEDFESKQIIHSNKKSELKTIFFNPNILKILVDQAPVINKYFSETMIIISMMIHHKSFNPNATKNIDILKQLIAYILTFVIHERNNEEPLYGIMLDEWLKICAKMHNEFNMKIHINDANITKQIKMIMAYAENPAFVLDIDVNLLRNQEILQFYKSLHSEHQQEDIIAFATKSMQNDEIFKILIQNTDPSALQYMESSVQSISVYIKMLKLKIFCATVNEKFIWELIAFDLGVEPDLIEVFINEYGGDILLLEYIDDLLNKQHIDVLRHEGDIWTITQILEYIKVNSRLSEIGSILMKTKHFDSTIIKIYGEKRMKSVLYEIRHYWFNDFIEAVMKHDLSIMSYLARFESLAEHIDVGCFDWKYHG